MIINSTVWNITLLYTNSILSHTISNYTIYNIKSSYIIKSLEKIEWEKESLKAKATGWESGREKKNRKKKRKYKRDSKRN